MNISDIPEATASDERTEGINVTEEEKEDTDDKKLQLTTSYEGFSIWGWVLCLLVTRKGRTKAHTGAVAGDAATSGQALMEEWIGTQMQPALDED